MTKPPWPDCGAVHASDDARAVGRFQPGGPFGYAANYDGGSIYATRQEAEQATCDRRRGDKHPSQPHTEAAPNRAASLIPGGKP